MLLDVALPTEHIAFLRFELHQINRPHHRNFAQRTEFLCLVAMMEVWIGGNFTTPETRQFSKPHQHVAAYLSMLALAVLLRPSHLPRLNAVLPSMSFAHFSLPSWPHFVVPSHIFAKIRALTHFADPFRRLTMLAHAFLYTIKEPYVNSSI